MTFNTHAEVGFHCEHAMPGGSIVVDESQIV
jgi:hypothetical protein